MVGSDRKKLNSAAARFSTRSISAPTIVAPDRDTPGTIARHCATPISSALMGPT